MLRRALFIIALLAAPVAAAADGPTDADRARAALRGGEIRPLAGILAGIEERYEGRVIATELERHHDRWIYEFKLLPPTGRIYTLRVDASTGQLLETHGPAEERR